MASQYENPQVNHKVNVGVRSSVWEFVSLSVALAAGVVVFVVAAYFSMRWLLPYVPFEWEVRLAQPVASALARQKAQSSRSEAKTRYLQNLARQLATHMEAPTHWPLTVHWSESREPNAFAMLGGHIVITQGVIDAVESENALAMVLAHEIAHILHRDPLVAIGSRALVSLSLGALLGTGGESVLSHTSALLSQLQFSRQQEYRADASALLALERHYGHVKGADGFFLRMLGTPSAQQHRPEIWRTHPDVQKRIERIRAAAAATSANAALTPLPALLQKP